MSVGGGGASAGMWRTVPVSHDLFNTSLSWCPIWPRLVDTSLNPPAAEKSGWLQNQDRGGRGGAGRGKIAVCKLDENQNDLRTEQLFLSWAAFSRKRCHGCGPLNIYGLVCRLWSREHRLTFYWTNIHFPTHVPTKFRSAARFTSRTVSSEEERRFFPIFIAVFRRHVWARAADQYVLTGNTSAEDDGAEKNALWEH